MAKLTSELLRPVDPAAALDEAALLCYLAANVPGFPGPAPALSLTQFGHGQSNPTYCVHASASAPGGGPARRYVLRKKPPGAILQSAHAVEREYQVRSVPVISVSPAPLFFCGSVSVACASKRARIRCASGCDLVLCVCS
jgi:acyl-CoA dehydrogenase